VLGSWLAACSATRSPDAGSQTHFLDSCSAHCAAPYSCICGVCTLECSDDARCAAQAEAATCLDAAAGGGASCTQTGSTCDVECERDAECSALGAEFGCAAGRCRVGAEPLQSGAGAGAGAAGTGGIGNTAGSGGRAGSTSTAQRGEGGQGVDDESSNSDDVCGDFQRSVAELLAKNEACTVDADCTIVGDCSGGFGFYAINLAGSAEAQALSDATPDGCAAFDGPQYNAQCAQNKCIAVEAPRSCGERSPTADPICNGSDAIRLSLDISGGGLVPSSYAFTHPHGHAYLFVDGRCTFYVSGLDYMTGIHTGTLPPDFAAQLATDIHWAELPELEGMGPDACPDGSYTTINALGFKARCSCGSCGTDAPPGKLEAIQKAGEWIQMVSELGVPLRGPVSALVMPEEASRTGDPATWSLSRAITDIPGLVVRAGTSTSAGSGVRFDDDVDNAALRALRDRQHSMYPNQGFARVWMSVGEPVYELYVRDELPPEVESAFTEFLK